MSTRLLSISCTESDDYEVILDVDRQLQSMRCGVVESHGIRVVQSKPGLMSRLAFSPQLLAAAVLAFDDATKDKGS